MKKTLLILFFTGFFTFSFGYCCPQSCDSSVVSAFGKLQKAVKEAYNDNLNKLQKAIDSYNTLTQTESNSTMLLNAYLQRVDIEYIDTKKDLFLTKKHTALKEYK